METGDYTIREIAECQNIATCPICRDLIQEAKILDCSHSFCLSCLKLHARNGKSGCPSCRAETVPSTEDKLELLPTNLFLSQLSHLVKQHLGRDPSNHRDLKCALCTRMFNDPRLLPCSHTFCFQCLLRYQNKKRLKGCPSCNSKIVPSRHEMPSLPVNTSAKQLVQLLQKWATGT